MRPCIRGGQEVNPALPTLENSAHLFGCYYKVKLKIESYDPSQNIGPMLVLTMDLKLLSTTTPKQEKY